MMFQYIEKISKEEKIDCLRIRLVDIAPRYMPPLRKAFNPLWMFGIHDRLSEPPRLVAVINLSKSVEELKADMDEDCRSAINKAERNGLSFVEGDYGDLDAYWRLHNETWSRTGMNPHSLMEIQEEWNVLAKESHLFFSYYEEEIVAAVMLHAYKTGVLYWGGCSKFGDQNLRANNFLLWSCIKWAKEKGYIWFNIGLFSPTPGDNLKEYNVGKYKSQFTKDYYEAYECQKKYR
jgi:lipid II:glycine glycyltransferase (peptidoglycan interpeptide bridge formation enzyme)